MQYNYCLSVVRKHYSTIAWETIFMNLRVDNRARCTLILPTRHYCVPAYFVLFAVSNWKKLIFKFRDPIEPMSVGCVLRMTLFRDYTASTCARKPLQTVLHRCIQVVS